MDIVGIFKDSIEVSKKNAVIFVPTVAVMIVIFILSLILVGAGILSMGITGGAMQSPAGMMSSIGALMGGVVLIGIAGTVLGLFAHGMTVGMVNEVFEKGSTSINGGISIAMSRFAQLLVGAVLVGLAVAVGMMLLLIPGLIAAFFLMFTFIIVVVDNMGAVDAMKRSIDLVKKNLSDMVIFFIAVMAAGVVFGILNMILNVIPLLGQLLSMALMGLFGGYISVVMMKVYRELTGKAS
ncbi:MAG: hypothetical protein HZA17_11170 [Nitrospirae bacterium]|nr:hypothetical protein [Nitrospirota bacterium]